MRPREDYATKRTIQAANQFNTDDVELLLWLACVCVSNFEQNKLSRESHYYPFLHTPQPTPLFQTDITNKLLARAHDVCPKSHLFTI